MPGVNRAA